MSTSLFLIIGFIAVALYAVLLYNKLISLRNRFRNAFAQIDVQLQRRYELIPNLVETASTYMKHESDTLTAVTEARNMASQSCAAASRNPEDASLIGALSSAEGALSGLMGKLNFVMESYPELKADATISDLHEELASTENRVAFSRQAFNDAVMRYNIAREQFPSVIVASIFSFKEAELFTVEDEQIKQHVQVSFSHQSAA